MPTTCANTTILHKFVFLSPGYSAASLNRGAIHQWEELVLFNLSGTEVAKYRSRLTGLTIALAKADTPIIHGDFCLSIKDEEDDGLPYLLQSAIFYGDALNIPAIHSLGKDREYGHKVDHTCYTLSTAGTSGFLEILPIYVDHILFPLFKTKDFLTEVRRIYDDSDDVAKSSAFVVYREAALASMLKAAKKLLFPGEPGYHALHEINKIYSSSIQRVVDYHTKYYRAENLVLIITGRIDQEEIFKRLTSIEEKILEKVKNQSNFRRPWQRPVQPLGNLSRYMALEFQSEDESFGEVHFGFKLPNHITKDISLLQACHNLLEYLTYYSESPLKAAFVESEDPLCSMVGFENYDYNQPAYVLYFSSVPTNRTREVIPRLRKIIKQINDDGPSMFELSRMRSFIRSGELWTQIFYEDNFHFLFQKAAISDLIFSTQQKHFQQFVDDRHIFFGLKGRNASYWLDLLNNIFNNYDSVVVEGKPSITLSKEYKMKEKVVHEKKKAEEEGLEKKSMKLETAVASLVQTRNELLTKIPIANVEKIQFRTIKRYNRTHNPQNLFDFSKVRFQVQLSDIRSIFVTMIIHMDVSYLTDKQKSYLPLLLDLWIYSSIKKNGTITTEKEMERRDKRTLFDIQTKIEHSSIKITTKCQLEKLHEGLSFLSDVINYPYFTTEQVNKSIMDRMNRELWEDEFITAIEKKLYYDKSTCIYFSDHVEQKKFLRRLKIVDGGKSILTDLYDIIETIARPENSFLHVAANTESLIGQFGSDLLIFNSIFNESTSAYSENKRKRFQVKQAPEYRKKHFNSPRHVGLGLESKESCHLSQFILYNNTDWQLKSIPALRVFTRYMQNILQALVDEEMETRSWVKIYPSLSDGRIFLKLEFVDKPAAAYKEVRKVFSDYFLGEVTWNRTLVDSAKGRLIYKWTQNEESLSSLVNTADKAYFRNVDVDYNRKFTKSLIRVKTKSLQSVAKQVLTQFLNSDLTQTVIVCDKGKMNEVARDFAKLDLRIKVYQSFENITL